MTARPSARSSAIRSLRLFQVHDVPGWPLGSRSVVHAVFVGYHRASVSGKLSGGDSMSRFTLAISLVLGAGLAQAGQDWPQLQGNALRSGNAPQTSLQTPL